ncbi:MAG: hypothetical protein ABW051_09175, partial [Burkholderiaceae bacterium]
GDALPDFATFHMEGHWDADGSQMAEAVKRVALGVPGAAPVRIRPLPWALMMLASPFVPTLREMREMRYLWQAPLRMENRRLVETLGFEPHTPLDAAVRQTLEGLGCLSPRAVAPGMASAG